MGHLLPYGIAGSAFLLLVCGMFLTVRWAKRNREAAGALLAVAMLFGANWVMPPPKPETEDLNSDAEDESGDGEPD